MMNSGVDPSVPPGPPTAGVLLLPIEAEVHAGMARTRYLRAGTGPTIVLLHGTGERAEVWMPWIGRLASHFRAPDAIGGQEGNGPLAMDHPVAGSIRLRDFLDGLGVESVSILARGDGAALAMYFTAEFPERVSEVLVVARDPPSPP